MKQLIFAAVTLFTAAIVASSASAKTATANIGESAQIVPGVTVSSYLVGGMPVIETTETPGALLRSGQRSLLQVSFDLEPSWHLVKRVTWNRARRLLTIDF